MGTRLVIKLADLLKKNNMSLEELSRRTNINQQTLMNLAECKNEEIVIEVLNKLINEFNLTDMNDIFSREKNQN